MKLINYKVTLRGDSITIPFDHPCKCNVGLVEISLPEINSHEMDFDNAIDITCDQIDSTFDNPERLLRRIPFNKIGQQKYYQTWTARFLQMESVDSQDKFLTIKLKHTKNGKTLTLGSIFEDKQILLTLAFSNVDAAESWTKYI